MGFLVTGVGLQVLGGVSLRADLQGRPFRVLCGLHASPFLRGQDRVKLRGVDANVPRSRPGGRCSLSRHLSGIAATLSGAKRHEFDTKRHDYYTSQTTVV